MEQFLLRRTGGLRDTVIDFGMMEMEFVTTKRLATFVTLFKERYIYGGQTTIKQSYKTRYERRPFGAGFQEYIEMYQLLINKNES
jgi:hypothetical protein